MQVPRLVVHIYTLAYFNVNHKTLRYLSFRRSIGVDTLIDDLDFIKVENGSGNDIWNLTPLATRLDFSKFLEQPMTNPIVIVILW